MSNSELIQIFMAGLGSIGFAMMFHLKGSKLWTIGAGSMLAWTIFLIGRDHGMPQLGLFGAAVTAAAIAEMEARSRKTPVLVMEVPLLVPMIPGGDLYRMMVSLMKNGIQASVGQIVWLVQEVFLIAAGVILVSALVSAFLRGKKLLTRL